MRRSCRTRIVAFSFRAAWSASERYPDGGALYRHLPHRPAPGQSQFTWKTTDGSSTPGRWPATSLRGQPSSTIGQRTRLPARGGAHPTV